jgi:hypothetical protein
MAKPGKMYAGPATSAEKAPCAVERNAVDGRRRWQWAVWAALHDLRCYRVIVARSWRVVEQVLADVGAA